MHLSSASPGVDPRDTQGLLLRGRNKTLTKPLGTGESLMSKIMLQPPTPGAKKANITSLTETIYYITGELDTKYSRKVNSF